MTGVCIKKLRQTSYTERLPREGSRDCDDAAEGRSAKDCQQITNLVQRHGTNLCPAPTPHLPRQPQKEGTNSDDSLTLNL